MNILWIDPIVKNDVYLRSLNENLNLIKNKSSKYDIISLENNKNPHHLRYHSYEIIASANIIKIIYNNRNIYDGFVIGCFYDTALREATEISGDSIVCAPCQSAITISSFLGNSFSILVGSLKGVNKMKDNIIRYGFEKNLCSFRNLNINVLDFQKNKNIVFEKMCEQASLAIKDGAEVIILGCSAEVGYNLKLQDELKVPVIDSGIAAFKQTEFLFNLKNSANLKHSKIISNEPPPEKEIESWKIFDI